MTGTADPQGFAGFVEAAIAGRARLLARADPLDPIELSDGEAFAAQVIETALQLVAVDPARPAFVPWQTPTRRYTDNGLDSMYRMAFVDERHRYRVTGTRAEECYLSISLYASDSGQPDRQVMSVNHVELDAAPGDHFELELTPTDGANVIITRQYSLAPKTQAIGSFAIDVIDGPPAEPSNEAALAAGWQRAARLLQALSADAPLRDPPPPWVSNAVNTMGDPSGRQVDPVVGRGAADQLYASGSFSLGEDEALVMETRFPKAAYASATVWNRYAQSVDPRFHRSTINHRNARASADGSVRLVVAARDPGVANWLDAGGRRRGSVFWRYLLVEESPAPIHCYVVPLSEWTKEPNDEGCTSRGWSAGRSDL